MVVSQPFDHFDVILSVQLSDDGMKQIFVGQNNMLNVIDHFIFFKNTAYDQ